MAQSLIQLLSSPSLEGSEWQIKLLTPYCDKIGLTLFPAVAHLTLATFVASFGVQLLSKIFCPVLFPSYYPTAAQKRSDWDVHLVGWLFSIISAPFGLALVLDPSPGVVQDPIFGYGLAEARLAALGSGYFFWDAWVSGRHINTQGLGFFVHGLGSGVALLFTLSPMLLYGGPTFLMWEWSTIFLNIHWYLDKFQMTGSIFQLVNGIILLLVFFSARLIWGTYSSFKMMHLLFFEEHATPIGSLPFLYLTTNLALNGLNFFWFRAMISALKKRFSVKAGSDAAKEVFQVDGKLNWKRKSEKAE